MEGILINAEELVDLIREQQAIVFDCRFDLLHPGRGRNSWLAAHLPEAVYADLDQNLAGRQTTRSGRHPLPSARSFAAFLGRSGWAPGKKLVAYDAQGGVFAARLWWLMKYFSLGNAAVLDGGIGAWMASGYPMEPGEVKPKRQPAPELHPNPDMILNTNGVLTGLVNEEILLVDARSEARFQGIEEPIDPVAGHIPGAVNYPTDRIIENGSFFRGEHSLAAGFKGLMKKHDASSVVHMCGSGVTACHNHFAMELAGLEGSKVYVGSWSEWIRDPGRRVVQGAK
jgi:thiosulfate/3-mercaptopyruvate sulfurtransferase